MKRRISFVAVPPKNGRIRYLRIRPGVIVFLLIVFSGGFAGLFIPFNQLSLDVVEINQKRNLTEQNRKLLSKIRSMREIFFTLKRKVDTLNLIKGEIENIITLEAPATNEDINTEEAVSSRPLDDIVRYVDSRESFFSSFLEKVQQNPAYFNALPLIKPITEHSVVTAHFGKRKDPFTGDIKWHNGVDFSAAQETQVIASASGTVDKVDNNDYWGQRVRIQHRFGFSTQYAHLGSVYVYNGKTVKKGEVIATIGISGLATGPHLHYEILYNDKPINPELLFFPDTLSLAAR